MKLNTSKLINQTGGRAMTDNTEPTIDEYLDRISELNKLGYPDLDGACNICGVHPDALKALIANQVREARIKELKLWQSYWKNGKDTRNTDSYVSDRIKELGE